MTTPLSAGHREGSGQPRETVPALVRCRGVSRVYGRSPTAVRALHQVSCTVRPGMRVAVTGPSGSGKSTLLHLMAALDTPSAGQIDWPALGATPTSRAGLVGVVFQGPSLLPALDVTENVALPLLFDGATGPAAASAATQALQRLGIEELAAKLPEELSGGQAQRVAVARVLASRPRLILADEPTGQLDHATGEQVVTVLLAAAGELDAALVVATHDPTVTARLDEQWQIRDGRLLVPEQHPTDHPCGNGNRP